MSELSQRNSRQWWWRGANEGIVTIHSNICCHVRLWSQMWHMLVLSSGRKELWFVAFDNSHLCTFFHIANFKPLLRLWLNMFGGGINSFTMPSPSVARFPISWSKKFEFLYKTFQFWKYYIAHTIQSWTEPWSCLQPLAMNRW